MASKKLPLVSDQVRAAIDGCGLTRYEVGKRSGVDHSAISRFMSWERGLSSEALDAVGAVIGLKVSIPKQPRK